MEKEKRVPSGLRFPESLDKKIREMMIAEKKDNFSAFVVDLCWKGIDRYDPDKEVIEKTDSTQKETLPDERAQ